MTFDFKEFAIDMARTQARAVKEQRTTTVSRLEVLDAISDAMLLHGTKALDNPNTTDDDELRELDRLKHLRTAIMAGAQMEPLI